LVPGSIWGGKEGATNKSDVALQAAIQQKRKNKERMTQLLKMKLMRDTLLVVIKPNLLWHYQLTLIRVRNLFFDRAWGKVSQIIKKVI
jgi:hypothetical protein